MRVRFSLPAPKLYNEIMKENKPIIYDVRSQEEFDFGHAIDAKHWPITKLRQGDLPHVDLNTTIFTYCNSGNRAGEAADLLRQAGFINAKSLGGLKESGLPITGQYYNDN